MSQEANQWIDAVTKLTALTQDGKLTWETRAPYMSVASTVGPSYFVEYKGRRLRLEKRSFRDPDYPEYRPIIQRSVLEFVDVEDKALWTFPHVDAVEHLYGAVGYQTAGVKGFLDDLLKEGKE